MVEEFNDFCFDPPGNPGDTGIVFNEGTYCGYHIIYFVSWGEPYRDVLADDSLRSADFSAWDAEISEAMRPPSASACATPCKRGHRIWNLRSPLPSGKGERV